VFKLKRKNLKIIFLLLQQKLPEEIAYLWVFGQTEISTLKKKQVLIIQVFEIQNIKISF
jgi:hypothetical protein